MTLHQSFGVNSVDIDAPDVRAALAGLLVRDTAHVVRSGILSPKVRTLITARSDGFRVDVAPFIAAQGRSKTSYGAALAGNDGVVQVTFPDGAPTANSRIDALVLFMPDSTEGDAAGLPTLAVIPGNPSASPQKPTIPTRAIEIGTAQIPSTATAMTSQNVVVTPTMRFTTVQGGRIPFRTLADIQAETLLPEGTLAYLDNGSGRTYRYDGTSWRLWEQPPTVTTLTLSSAGFNLGSLGSALFVVSVVAGRVTVDFRLRAAGSGIAWGDIRYGLPFPAFDAFAISNAMTGAADVNDNDGGSYNAGVGVMSDGSWRVWRTGTDNGSSASWAGSQPFTIAAGDTITGSFSYPAA